ncbi:MAG TPA: S8 family serine peptidase [Pyrinomonadaceae bacterium]
MKKILFLAAAILFSALFFNFSPHNSQAQNLTEKEMRRQEKFARLIEKANRKGAARVIVGFRGDFQPEGALDETSVGEQRRRIKDKQEKFLNRHAARVDKVKKFEFVPFVAFETDAASLQQIQTDSEIESIEEDELAKPTLAESTALTGAKTAWTLGFSGSGQAVAVLDTGVDKNHTFLSGKVVSEACYSSNYTDSTSFCPGSVTASTDANSGVNCPTAIDGCAHGTHVAGIVAGRGANFSGVAKDANIISIQVFSNINNAEDCDGAAPCALSYTSDQLKALERVRVLSGSMSIAAVNMSLGGGEYTANCDAESPSRKAIIDNLRSLGIATVVASGNDGYTAAISSPACVSSAVSVGSIDDGSYGTVANTVSSFSNSSPLLTILAPGKYITSSVPNNGYATYAGTSMATPHVAAAFAVLKQKKPTASVTEILSALVSTGLSITDSRNSITKPSIKIDAALGALGGTTTTQTARAKFDFDGDGKTDVGVFRPANGVWYIQNSAGGTNNIQQFGLGTDLLAPGDFTGDGKADIAVWRSATGEWFILRSENGSFMSFKFGQAGDTPAVGDFDGDGKADAGIFRPQSGEWFIQKSSGGTAITTFGTAGDVPATADFDGDGRSDIAIYRPSNGQWWIQRSSNSSVYAFQFGTSTDKPVQGDFTGDGKADAAFFRPATGEWFILRSEDSSFYSVPFGASGDLPAPGDYDGDGRFDTAVFRPVGGTWYVQRSTAGIMITNFGLAGDKTVAGAFVP